MPRSTWSTRGSKAGSACSRGSWDRQDVHYELAANALARGCIFALDSDAHSHPELDFIDISIAHARLAGIPQTRIVNYWSEARFLKWARGAWER
jgi:putative hydrolase